MAPIAQPVSPGTSHMSELDCGEQVEQLDQWCFSLQEGSTRFVFCVKSVCSLGPGSLESLGRQAYRANCY